ncbi:hypothetical protein ACU4GD_37330 [Cupriavidus basilensis]
MAWACRTARAATLRKSFPVGAAAVPGPVPAAGRAQRKGRRRRHPHAATLGHHAGQPVAAPPPAPPPTRKTWCGARSPGLDPCVRRLLSFAPLQGFFGLITPNGLHFERHHFRAGRTSIRPATA